MRNSKKIMKGFSLIELSIVILIVSIFASAMLNIIGKKNVVDKEAETKAKMERIMEALRVYAAGENSENPRALPCPAPLVITLEDASFGYGIENGICDSYNSIDNDSSVVSGGVPVVNLGLPAEYAFDAWGNKIVYVVDRNFVLGNFWQIGTAPNPNFSVLANIIRDTSSNIIIQDKDGNTLKTSINSADLQNNAVDPKDCAGESISDAISNQDYTAQIAYCPAVLLISHGANGYLAYNSVGTQTLTSFGTTGNLWQNENTSGPDNFDNIFVDAPLNQDTKDPSFTNYFDDILVYRHASYFVVPVQDMNVIFNNNN